MVIRGINERIGANEQLTKTPECVEFGFDCPERAESIWSELKINNVGGELRAAVNVWERIGLRAANLHVMWQLPPLCPLQNGTVAFSSNAEASVAVKENPKLMEKNKNAW